MTHRIGDLIAPWMDQAIDDHGQGENIRWESAMLSNQQGQPTFAIVVWMPGAILGTVVNGSFVLANPMTVTAEDIDKLMAQFLHQMREQRSAQLVKQNGHRPGGLIVPGG